MNKKGIDRREFIKGMSCAGLSVPFILSGCDFKSQDNKVLKKKLKKAGFRKVIVIGIDGFDPKIIELMMSKGELPNFFRLKETGSFSSLETSNPPQSPTAWSSIATGNNPGTHGIFDFIKRDTKTYLPQLSLLTNNPKAMLPWSPIFLPTMKGTPFWDITSEAGIPSTVVKWPVTFPSEKGPSKVIAGLGVPDIKGEMGKYTFYTTRSFLGYEEGKEKIFEVERIDNEINTKIKGPVFSGVYGKRISEIDLNIKISNDDSSVNIIIDEQSFHLKQGQWSSWIRVKFSLGFMKDVTGICKFFLTNISPELELYLTPVQVDPKDPCFPISNPEGYAAELASQTEDAFYTLGLPEDTKALSENRIGEDAFLQMCDDIVSEQEKMLWYELENFREGLLSYAFCTTDRIHHMFWHTSDDENNFHDEGLKEKYKNVIPQYYKRMDGIIGRISEYVDDKTAIIVFSDHGFTSFRKEVNLNTWLVKNGLISVIRDARYDDDKNNKSMFKYVDWNKTRAYALGFGSIYLNLKGRERSGIVEKGSEAEKVINEIIVKLKELKDPETNDYIVKAVYRKEDIYQGPYLDDAPDLVVGFYPVYRMSWQTAIGGYSDDILNDNKNKWAGDHCMDPSFVPGFFLSNQKINTENPRIIDIAPTILDCFKLSASKDMDGHSLLMRNT